MREFIRKAIDAIDNRSRHAIAACADIGKRVGRRRPDRPFKALA
jgi:hypothetical protein